MNQGRLEVLWTPKSIALVGVSQDPEKISGGLLSILEAGGYAGTIYPVNPKYREMVGRTCYPALSDLPAVPDVVAVLLPSQLVPKVVQEAVALEVPFVVVFSSGFEEATESGKILKQRTDELVRDSRTQILGPNCEGYLSRMADTYLTFSPVVDPKRGRVPLRKGPTVVLSQSGGLGFALADQLDAQGIGIHSVVTTGNEWDLDLSTFVEWFSRDGSVEDIVMLFEGIRDPSQWAYVLQQAKKRHKRLWAIPIGASPVGRLAVPRHTGKRALKGADIGILETLGVEIPEDVDALCDGIWGSRLATLLPSPTRRLAIVSSSGGAGIWCGDLAFRTTIAVPPPSAGLAGRLRSLLPSYASLNNPIDVTAQAIFDGSMAKAIQAIVGSGEYDAVIIAATLGYDNALLRDPDLLRTLESQTVPVVVFSYTPPSPRARETLRSVMVPCVSSPLRAMRIVSIALNFPGGAS